MNNIKCADCEEYRNEWCEKVVDSPHPDLLRDCEHYRERDKNLIRVTRCKDCDWWTKQDASLQGRCARYGMYPTGEWYCAGAERREDAKKI